MRKDNLFVFGPEAAGESFLGRRADVNRLRNVVHAPRTNIGVAVIGLNRVGKTSLVKRVLDEEFRQDDRTLILMERVNSFNTANELWDRLLVDLELELERKKVEDDTIRDCIRRIAEGRSDPRWFASVFSSRFSILLDRLKELDRRVVILLDEFDAARKLFQDSPGSLGVIRDMASLASQSVTLITVSRRQLHVIEACAAASNSTLSGAFTEKYYLGAFDPVEDMMEFKMALTDYEIFLSPAEEARLLELTGRQPILLSFYGQRMAELAMKGKPVDLAAIDQIARDQAPAQLRSLYDTWLDRIEEDGYTVPLREILCGPRMTVTIDSERDLELMGYLSRDDEGLFCISRDFTAYFLDNTEKLALSTWEDLSRAEETLRTVMKHAYPELERFRYSYLVHRRDWLREVERDCPDFRDILNEKEIMSRMEDSQRQYGRDQTIIDTLDLSFTLKRMEEHWDRFRPFFRNEDREQWRPQLALLAKVRNPLSHAHSDYLTKEEIGLAAIYCDQIAALGKQFE